MATFDSATTIDPSHVIALPESWRISNLVFSPDGQALYAQCTAATFSIWRLLVHLWPWLLGVPAAAVCVVSLVALVRIARRPQLVGHLHCRRCNYDLFGSLGNTCPECGGDSSPRNLQLGRSRKRRSVRWVLAIALCASGYGLLHTFPGWQSWVATLFRMDSQAARQFTKAWKIEWLEQFFSFRSRVVEFDPASGKLVREITEGASLDSTILLSPDGSVMITQDARGSLRAIDPETGREIAVAHRPDGLVGRGTWFAPGWRSVAGFSDDSTSAFVQFFDGAASKNTLYRWNLAAGNLTPLLTLDTTPPPGSGSTPAVRRFRVLAGTRPLLVAELRDSVEHWTGMGETTDLIIRSTEDRCSEVRKVTGRFWTDSWPHIDPARDRLYIHEWSGIGVYEISSGKRVAEIEAPGFMGTVQDGVAVHSASGRLFVSASSPDQVSVWDQDSRVWVARLRFPKLDNSLPPDDICVSRDGRRVAVQYVEVIRPGPPVQSAPSQLTLLSAQAYEFRNMLVIYDLPAELPVKPKPSDR